MIAQTQLGRDVREKACFFVFFLPNVALPFSDVFFLSLVLQSCIAEHLRAGWLRKENNSQSLMLYAQYKCAKVKGCRATQLTPSHFPSVRSF